MISLSPRNGGQAYSVATAAVRHWYWGDWLAKNGDGLPCEGGGVWDGSSAMRLAGTEHKLKTTWMNEINVVIIGYSLHPILWEARVLTKAQENAHFITHTNTLSLSLSCTHTHTQTLSLSLSHSLWIQALLVMGWYNEKKTTDERAEEKRRVFSFDLNLKEVSEDECLTQWHSEEESSRSHVTFHLVHHSQWPNISNDNLHLH